MTGPAKTSTSADPSTATSSSAATKTVAIGSANCSLNDSAIDAESIIMKLQQYKSDVVRQVNNICTQRSQLLEQQRRQCQENLDKELCQLSSRQLTLNYPDYVRSVQLPSLIQLGVSLPGGVALDSGTGAPTTTGVARGNAATRGRGAGRTARGRHAGAAAAAAIASSAAASTARSRTGPTKLSIVNPFKFSAEDLERIDPREVQKLRELFDKLACLFGSDSGVGSH